MLADLPLHSLRAALDRLLDGQPAARIHLARHAGKRVVIRLPLLDLPLRIGEDGCPRVATAAEESAETPADCRIGLGPELLPGLLLGGREVLKRARVDGDGVLANDLAAALRDFDWGLALRPWLGDILAARAAQGIAGFARWRDQARASLGEAGAEYLAYESGLLADAPAVRGFIADVDELRDAAARLEARLALLERREP